MDVDKIIAGLSEAEKRVDWLASGRKRLPDAVFSLHAKGLVRIIPAMGGWAWRPTETGLAVRARLLEQGEG